MKNNEPSSTPLDKLFHFLVYKPVVSLMLLIAVLVPIIMQAPKMALDMSSESLMSSGDGELDFYLKTQETFKVVDDQLIIAFHTEDGVLTPENLEAIAALKADLLALDRVESVTSILDVPLFESPHLNIFDMVNITVTIENGRAGKTIEQIKAEIKAEME